MVLLEVVLDPSGGLSVVVVVSVRVSVFLDGGFTMTVLLGAWSWTTVVLPGVTTTSGGGLHPTAHTLANATVINRFAGLNSFISLSSWQSYTLLGLVDSAHSYVPASR